ncbi:hypothetical protein Ancab_024175 [Ancistrocladus abbreviatus]
MEDSQGDSNVLSVRIVSIDYYMAPPIPDMDICYSSFQAGKVQEVPVIRVYGSTPAGQKACIHIHRALPYLYIPCSDIPLQANPEGDAHRNALLLAIEKALTLKGSAGSKRQHVHGCSIVRAKKLYGYHSSEELFMKIYLYYPHDVPRAASLLLGAAILEKSLQPHESHIPFLLQFLVDCNLYGMGHLHLKKMKFRHPVPDEVYPGNCISSNEIACTSANCQADTGSGSSLGSQVWRRSTIPDGWMWHHSGELAASPDHGIHLVRRQSTCELEGDTVVDDIMNQQLKIYASFSQSLADVRMVQSLISIWEEEYERTGFHDIGILPDPSKPQPKDVLRILLDGLEYVNKLHQLCSEAENKLLTTLPKNVVSELPVRSTAQEGSSIGLGTHSDVQTLRCHNAVEIAHSELQRDSLLEGVDGLSDDGGRDACLSSADERCTLQKAEESNLKVVDTEALSLLKWFASSQAAEDMNSDDELAQDAIISPLLPVALLDKVLEKANINYESESQQECQDILDSVEGIVGFQHLEEKPCFNDQTKSTQALSNKIIPQLDDAGDGKSSTPAANSFEVEMDVELMRARCKPFKGKRKSQKSPWCSLPVSAAENVVNGLSVSVNEGCSGKIENDTMNCSSAGYEVQNNRDSFSNSGDTSSSSLKGIKPFPECSVRDLMRKKRCYRVEPSELGSIREKEPSVQEGTKFCPRKLEFHMELFEDLEMQPLQSFNGKHICVDQQREVCETRLHSVTKSPHKVSLDMPQVPIKNQGPPQLNETRLHGSAVLLDDGTKGRGKESMSGMPTAISSCSNVNNDQSVVKRCLKFDSDVGVLVDGKLQQRDNHRSSCLSNSDRRGEMLDGASNLGKVNNEHGMTAAALLPNVHSEDLELMVVKSVTQHDQFCSREQNTSFSQTLTSDFCCVEENKAGEYLGMTFHKKPPVVSCMNIASQNTLLGSTAPNRPPLNGVNSYEGISVQSRGLYEFVPFFTEDSQEKSESPRRCWSRRNPTIGVPTFYQSDSSCSYLLTPALSPPSVDSVCKWLLSRDAGTLREDVDTELDKLPSPEDFLAGPREKLLPESKPVYSSEPILTHLNQEKPRSPIAEESALCDGMRVAMQDEQGIVEIKESTKSSQDISQISGPSNRSDPTPLSQIGFRDPASVGGGQQLTLFSVEIQAEARGDLRPDPQCDGINIVAVAIQNDNSSILDVHVLLRCATEPCWRKLDGVSGCKILTFSEERDLLDHFVKITRAFDPDILMGWDVQGCSLGFLAERASYLGFSLLNKISRTPSEKKIDDRDSDDLVKGNADAVVTDPNIQEAIIEDEWGRTHASGVHVGGRIVLNVWRLMRGELKLNMYTQEAVVQAVLRRKLPSINWKLLNQWFLSGPGKARYRCIDYMVERAKLNLEIMSTLDMINRTSELARIFGIDFFSVLSRGSQYRVESMLIRLAHSQNYIAISPGYQQVASQPAMECLPLVMEPESGFYADPVVVLDFQSLYPSMIIAYNLCFCTCLGKVGPSKTDVLGVSMYSPDLHVLRELNQEILLTPNGVMYVPSKVRKGVLPRLLEEILSTRIMVKQAMKKLAPSQQILHRILNARQLALKLIANVTYGYTAAGFSGRMPCAELADSIVQCGRRTLENAISFVNSHHEWNARVIYGDTDSMFVLLKGRSLRDAFKIGQEIASTISAMNPNPVTLKMEKVYQPCFLITKKRYVGYSYESLDQLKPIFDAKGIETVRRDTCGAVAKTMEKSLRTFFENQNISEVKVYLQRQWSRILSGRVSIQDFVFAKEVRLGTYSTRASSSLPPAAIVATKAMRADPRAEPRYGERIPYVVIHGEPGARLVDMVVDPLDLLAIDSPYRLNDLYYINKQIIPALQRVLGLVGANLNLWLVEMSRPVRDAPSKHHYNAPNAHRTRIDYYYLSKHCILCGELIQATAHLCEQCSKNGAAATAAMTGRTSKLERDMQHLSAICRHCGGGDWLVESGVKCTSLACSVFYERWKVQKELRAVSTVATDAGLYPKCSVEWF